MITAEQLREELAYCPNTGKFVRLKRAARRVKVGDVPGWSAQGYRLMNVQKKTYWAHRLAWLYVYGSWPNGQIDHINGDRSDNRIANLRDVTPSVNSQNQRRAKAHNSVGVLGVYKHGTRFRARIRHKGRLCCLGIYDSADAAYGAYVAAKRKLHEGCTL